MAVFAGSAALVFAVLRRRGRANSDLLRRYGRASLLLLGWTAVAVANIVDHRH